MKGGARPVEEIEKMRNNGHSFARLGQGNRMSS